MKNLYLLFVTAILTCNFSIAQYQVSTDVQPKNILLEEFTGINCGNCPSAHKIAANLLLAQENTFYSKQYTADIMHRLSPTSQIFALPKVKS